MKSLLLLFCVLAAAPTARAQLFQITDRTYGNIPPGQEAEMDAVFDALENEVNANLPDADTGTYLKGIANASVLSGAGIGVDYAAPFKVALLGFNFGLGADLGSVPLSDLLNGNADLSRVGGIAGQGSVLLGISLAPYLSGKSALFDPARLKIFAGFFKKSISRETADLAFTAFSLHGQYKIITGGMKGAGLAKWGGLDVTTGLRSSAMRVEINQSVTEGVTQSSTYPGNPSITSTFVGNVNAGADTNIYTIPIDVSTSARLLYVLGFFAGLGMDMSFGSANSIANLTGPITTTDSANSLGVITGQAALDLGENTGPTLSNVRYFAGAQIEMGVLAISLQFNQSLTNSTLGANLGVKAFW
jgi:hypothetical protein